MSGRASYVGTAVVWICAFAFLGLPTAYVVGAAIAGAFALAGVELASWFGIAAALLALLVGVKAADEATRVRLHGWQELHRGSFARVVVRHALLAVPAVVLLAFLVATAVGLGTSLREIGSPLGLALFAAVVGSIAFVAVRTVRSFLEGRREALDGDEEQSTSSRVLR